MGVCGYIPSFIRCAFAEGKAPSYIDGGCVYIRQRRLPKAKPLARRMGSKGEGGELGQPLKERSGKLEASVRFGMDS